MYIEYDRFINRQEEKEYPSYTINKGYDINGNIISEKVMFEKDGQYLVVEKKVGTHPFQCGWRDDVMFYNALGIALLDKDRYPTPQEIYRPEVKTFFLKEYITDCHDYLGMIKIPNHKTVHAIRDNTNRKTCMTYGLNNYTMYETKNYMINHDKIKATFFENIEEKDYDLIGTNNRLAFNDVTVWKNKDNNSGLLLDALIDDDWRGMEIAKDNDNITINIYKDYYGHSENKTSFQIPKLRYGPITPEEIQLIIDRLSQDHYNSSIPTIDDRFIDLVIEELQIIKQRLYDNNNIKNAEPDPLDPVYLSTLSIEEIAKRIDGNLDNYFKLANEQYEKELSDNKKERKKLEKRDN